MGVSYVLMTEKEAFSGVKRTAEKVAEDFRRVTGTRPELRTEVGADDFRKAAEEGGFTGMIVVGADLASVRLPAK